MPAYRCATCSRVTVERQCGDAVAEQVDAGAGDAAFGLLAPARMVDGRIHVGIETVFVGSRHVPCRLRLAFEEFDFDNRLDALEAVFPWHDQAQRRAVLVWQFAPVHAHGEQGQRMHGLVHAQAFAIGPIEHRIGEAGHLRRSFDRRESDVFRRSQRLAALEQSGEREAGPGDHHRPGFDAAHAVDAFFQRLALEDVFEREVSGFFGQAGDFHAPRSWLESAGMGSRIALAGAELVEIVVVRGIPKSGLHGAIGIVDVTDDRQRPARGARFRCRRSGRRGLGTAACGEGGCAESKQFQDFTTATVNRFRRDCRWRRVFGWISAHVVFPIAPMGPAIVHKASSQAPGT